MQCQITKPGIFLFQVCFSDESTFEIMDDKAQHVRRRIGEEFHEDCVVNTVKHPTKIMVWSVISGKGTGRLQIINGMMNQHSYKVILESRLIPQIEEWFLETDNYIFMQDSAPCHTARSIKAFLNEKNIPLLDWPGNSPDLNPIENLWELTKHRINSECLITTKNQLIERLIAVWHRDDDLKRLAKNCIESMPRRIAAVIKAKGGPTKY